MDNSTKKGFSIASMVLGIVALALGCCIPYLPIVLAVIGLVLAIVSLKNHHGGKGMAIAGLVCSIIALVPSILLVAGVMSAVSLGSMGL